MRRALFRHVPLRGKVNGQTEATVTIEQGENGEGLFRVRPAHSRKEFSWALGEVAEMVCWKDARAAALKNGGR